MKIVNLFGGPGAGKTSVAFGVAASLKAIGLDVEYIPEYTRDLSLEGRLRGADQFTILKEQFGRFLRVMGTGMDVVVTDSPILIQAAYAPDLVNLARVMELSEMLRMYDQFNYVVVSPRDKHNLLGREHTKEQAEELDEHIHSILAETQPKHMETVKLVGATDRIVQDVCSALSKERNGVVLRK